MFNHVRTTGVMAAALAALLWLPATSTGAVLSGVCSQVDGDDADGEFGQCSKTMTLSDDGMTLTIALTNTSPAANGGFITADAFLLPDIGIADWSSTDADFTFFSPFDGNVSGGEVAGFNRNALFSISDNWEGGGQPSAGIGVGETATFTLLFDSMLEEADFLAAFASEAIRFRGFANGASDKDLIVPGDDVTIPEPTTMLLLGMGAIGLGSHLRRRR